MNDSIDKKSKEQNDKLDAELDAMLDELQFPIPPIDDIHNDEDAIDRLLKNAGFDDATEIGGEAENNNELPDLSDFDDLETEFAKTVLSESPIIHENEKHNELSGQDSSVAPFLLNDDELDSLLIESGSETDNNATLEEQEELQNLENLFDLDNELFDSEVSESDEKVTSDLGHLFAADLDLDDVNDTQPEDFSSAAIFTPETTEPFSSGSHTDDDIDLNSTLSARDDSTDKDDFSDFSDFVEPELKSVSFTDEMDLITEDFKADIESPVPAKEEELTDSTSQFTGFGDDYDFSDITETDDEVLANKTAMEALPDLEEEQDQQAFNQLLQDTDFELANDLEHTLDSPDESKEINDFFKLDEVSDDFSKQIEDQLAEAENITPTQSHEDDFLLPDFDITADLENPDSISNSVSDDELGVLFSDTDFLDHENTLQNVDFDDKGFNEPFIAPTPEQAPLTDTSEDVKKVMSSQSESGQEDFKKQLEEARIAAKKTKLLVYIALGFAGVAVSAAVGLGVMTYKAKNEVSKLTETVTTLETKLAKIAESNPNSEINALVNSIVQLNQQVYGFIAEIKSNTQVPVEFLDNKITHLVMKQEMVSKALSMLQDKMGGALDKVTLQSFVMETHKPELSHESIVPDTESKIPDNVPLKTEITHVPTNVASVPEMIPNKKEALKEIVPAKEKIKQVVPVTKVENKQLTAPVETKSEKKQATVETGNATAKVKNKPATPSLKQEPLQAKVPKSLSNWGVNLVAFKQEWFAKSKAAEFARQGIYAEVIPVPGNNSTLYRLRVEGFKNKAEATASKDKIKKVLKLDSVWVSDN